MGLEPLDVHTAQPTTCENTDSSPNARGEDGRKVSMDKPGAYETKATPAFYDVTPTDED